MTVIVIRILRFGTDADKDQDDQVRQEVRQGMDGIGYHRRTAGHDTGHKLEAEQHQVPDAPHQRNFGEFPFARHSLSSTVSI